MAKKREETILTRNVNEGADGTRISKRKYDAMRHAILEAMPRGPEGIRFTQLFDAVVPHLPGDWEGAVSWYVTTVKLDLEARRLIERVPGAKPQRLRRVR